MWEIGKYLISNLFTISKYINKENIQDNTKENISYIHLDITKKTEYVRYVQRLNESGAKK